MDEFILNISGSMNKPPVCPAEYPYYNMWDFQCQIYKSIFILAQSQSWAYSEKHIEV